MTYLSHMARVAMLVGVCVLAGCDGGSTDPMDPVIPTPVVPAEGQFVWTAGVVTVTATDSFMLNRLKAVGYRFSGPSLVIEAATEELLFCSLATSATTLPAPGRYPVSGLGAGTFDVLCNDPTSPVAGNSFYVTGGE